MAELFIGVDVSKEWLDVFDPDKGFRRVSQTSRSLSDFAERYRDRDVLIVFEATGGYDAALREQLDAAQIAYHRANPARSRDFARAVGVIGKTDRVDARCLSQMGRQLELAPTPPLSAPHSALKKLAARRRQLVEMRKQERTRLKQAPHDPAVESIERMIGHFTAEIEQIEARMRSHVQDAALSQNATILQSMPGVGPIVAATILAELPEIGTTHRRAVAALVGLAPIANDSGCRKGKRQIGKGRAVLRSAFYIAALHASRHCSLFANLRKRLEDRGRTAKQAIIAVARKMLTMLNAMIKKGETFREQHSPSL